MKRLLVLGSCAAVLFSVGCSHTAPPEKAATPDAPELAASEPAASKPAAAEKNMTEKDATGVALTGQDITLKVSGDAPETYVAIKRNGGKASTYRIKLPYEISYNVHGGDKFEMVAGSEGAKTPTNLKIEVVADKKTVASAKEGLEMKGYAHVIYHVPKT